MTLILTALCEDGICICADKRYKIKNNGLVKFEDNHNKIFKFRNNCILIFNHGINKFKNKSWEMFCSDYEKSDQWIGKNLCWIVEDFKNFIEDGIRDELKNNKLDNAVGFVLCGRTSCQYDFEIYELFWSFNSGDLHFLRNPHKGLVRSGDGKKYLDNCISKNKQYDTIEYWEKINTIQAENELKKIFSIAVEEQKRLNGDEFSEEFNILSCT